MKRIIITSLLSACFISMSAQEKTKLDPMFNELRTLIHSGISTSRGNYGLGQTVTQTHVFVGSNDFCTKDACGEGQVFLDSIWDTATVNKRNNEIRDRIISIVRHHLDSISALPDTEESYHFESHHQGIDTIRYSICLHSGKGQVKRYDSTRGEYFYDDVPGTETVSFNYDTKLNPCGKHSQSMGTLTYSRTESVKGGKSVFFDWNQYMQAILPILNKKGITQRTFKWAQDKFYGDADKDYSFGYTILLDDNKHSVEGETSGTLYFIPADQFELAQAVCKDINYATQHYIYNHPEQTYQYSFDTQFTPITDDGRDNKEQMLRTMNLQEGFDQHFVFVCSDVRGYYFLFCDTKGALWVPRESLILKSFINGKKEYVKGMKPKK